MTATIVFAASLCCIVAATLVFAYQVVAFLKTGEWLPLSVLSALTWAGVSWAVYPIDWKGIHRILGWAPLSLSLYFSSVVPIALASLLGKDK